jgi:predicted amidophosphoribosyltransferase
MAPQNIEGGFQRGNLMSLNIITETRSNSVVEEELKTCKECGFKAPKNLVVCWNCGAHFDQR